MQLWREEGGQGQVLLVAVISWYNDIAEFSILAYSTLKYSIVPICFSDEKVL
jgi:hypothetical protein